eukprot:scaffold2140_cov394-Prasinococcus_capsulatus_cf.AAC.26
MRRRSVAPATTATHRVASGGPPAARSVQINDVAGVACTHASATRPHRRACLASTIGSRAAPNASPGGSGGPRPPHSRRWLEDATARASPHPPTHAHSVQTHVITCAHSSQSSEADVTAANRPGRVGTENRYQPCRIPREGTARRGLTVGPPLARRSPTRGGREDKRSHPLPVFLDAPPRALGRRRTSSDGRARARGPSGPEKGASGACLGVLFGGSGPLQRVVDVSERSWGKRVPGGTGHVHARRRARRRAHSLPAPRPAPDCARSLARPETGRAPCRATLAQRRAPGPRRRALAAGGVLARGRERTVDGGGPCPTPVVNNS